MMSDFRRRPTRTAHGGAAHWFSSRYRIRTIDGDEHGGWQYGIESIQELRAEVDAMTAPEDPPPAVEVERWSTSAGQYTRYAVLRTRHQTEQPEYCQAVTRRQFESGTWGGSHVGCGNKAKYYDEKTRRWYCHIHRDPDKRY